MEIKVDASPIRNIVSNGINLETKGEEKKRFSAQEKLLILSEITKDKQGL